MFYPLINIFVCNSIIVYSLYKHNMLMHYMYIPSNEIQENINKIMCMFIKVIFHK